VAFVDKMGASLDGSGGKVILTSVDALANWARSRSLWTMPMGTACCAMELIAGSFNKFDFDRHGTFPRPDPRHDDVMVVAGTITRKMAPAVKRLYEQMADPKWVIAMGACASSGGPFENYAIVQGADKLIPVDVYIPGCPPRPEALCYGVMQLYEKIQKETFADYK